MLVMCYTQLYEHMSVHLSTYKPQFVIEGLNDSSKASAGLSQQFVTSPHIGREGFLEGIVQ